METRVIRIENNFEIIGVFLNNVQINEFRRKVIFNF
jgi:hypothetical protein